MAELTWIPGALRGLFWLYLVSGVIALIAALTKPKTPTAKAAWTLAVALAFGAPFFFIAKGAREDKELALADKGRLKAATDLFDERCKGAGEKIARTVEDVEGVVWMKWRTERLSDADQFKLDDLYGNDCKEEECIDQLLRLSVDIHRFPKAASRHEKGYRFVETIDPRDGQRYRYIGAMKLRGSWTEEKIRSQ